MFYLKTNCREVDEDVKKIYAKELMTPGWTSNILQWVVKQNRYPRLSPKRRPPCSITLQGILGNARQHIHPPWGGSSSPDLTSPIGIGRWPESARPSYTCPDQLAPDALSCPGLNKDKLSTCPPAGSYSLWRSSIRFSIEAVFGYFLLCIFEFSYTSSPRREFRGGGSGHSTLI